MVAATSSLKGQPPTPGNQHDVGAGLVNGVGPEPEAVGPAHLERLPEAHQPGGEGGAGGRRGAQDLEGADGVELIHAVEDDDVDGGRWWSMVVVVVVVMART